MSGELRKKQIDPDFRPSPKTDRFCYLCGRDVKPKSKAAVILVAGDDPFSVIHPDHMPETLEGRWDWHRLIGSECKKKIGSEWYSDESVLDTSTQGIPDE